MQVVVEDGTGRLALVFFNQPWRARQLEVGSDVVVFGRTEIYRGARQMTNPVVDLVGDQTGRLVPVYRSRARRRSARPRSPPTSPRRSSEPAAWPKSCPNAGSMSSTSSGGRRRSRASTRPESFEERERARRRLAFDELLRLQLILVMKKRAAATQTPGIPHAVTPSAGTPELVQEFLGRLPFVLTEAQRRAIREVAADLGASYPMHRLLQGDVGAGKTVVALATLLYGVQGGHQGALMVPTEVLAEQHYLAARGFLGGLQVGGPDSSRRCPATRGCPADEPDHCGRALEDPSRPFGGQSRPRRRVRTLCSPTTSVSGRSGWR